MGIKPPSLYLCYNSVCIFKEGKRILSWLLSLPSILHACQVISVVSLRPMDHSPPLSMGFLRQEYWSGLPFLTVQINLLSHLSLYLMFGFLGHTWGFNFDAE